MLGHLQGAELLLPFLKNAAVLPPAGAATQTGTGQEYKRCACSW